MPYCCDRQKTVFLGTPLGKPGQLLLHDFYRMDMGTLFQRMYGDHPGEILEFRGFVEGDYWIKTQRVLSTGREVIERASLADMGVVPYEYNGETHGYNSQNWVRRVT